MTTSRVQLALNVADLETATALLQDMFGSSRPSAGPGTPTS